ncbi:MAG: hypothetical protein ACYC1D_17780, partial [Acidimicrobiales bacterium]
SGFYGDMARRAARGAPGSGASEEARRYFASPGRVEWALLGVPFLGAGALAARPGADQFARVWVAAAGGLWLVAVGLLIGVVRPAERVIRAGLASDGRAAGEVRGMAEMGAVAGAGRRLAWAAAASDLVFGAAFVLMVYRP